MSILCFNAGKLFGRRVLSCGAGTDVADSAISAVDGTFGVPLIKLQLDMLLIPYTPKLVEGIWFLLTDPLVVIEADRDLKRKLWQALQKMFETT